jgi:ATP-dependent protease ClpP protease subunit
MWGKYHEFIDEMKNLDRLMLMIKNIYNEFTKVPSEKLDEVLKHDLWFDAETCLKYGMVDEIL